MGTQSIKSVTALIGDVAFFYTSLLLTLIIRHRGNFEYTDFQQHFAPFSYVLLLWIVVFYVAGLYDLRASGRDINFFNLTIRSLAIAAGLAVAFFYLTGRLFFEIRPLTVLAIDIVVFTALFTLWRLLLSFAFSTRGLSYGALFLGNDDLSLEVSDELNNKPQLGFKTKKIITLGELNDLLDLKKICQDLKVSVLVISPEAMQNPMTVSKVYECLPLQVRIVDLPSFYEEVLGKIPIDAIGQTWFLEKISLHKRRIYDLAKRLGDVVLASILGILTLILSPLITLAIKLDSPGPAIFKQKRTGQNGKVIEIIKFRTMINQAEIAGQPIWSKKGDERITKVGSWLRKTRLDELPQLINIVRGDLSFVGPRPERPEFVEQLKQKIPFYGERHLVKPGLTGWAQISLPYDASELYSREKLQFDLFYVKNRSLLLDLGIILRTAKVVLSHAGR